MKKLLTIKQLIETDKEQDLNAELLEQPYDRVRKNELKFVPRNIVSDIENGIEITFDNVEYWNDIALSQLKPKERIHDKYRVGDRVSAFDYIKDPYDILYLVNLDGVYQGGTVVLTAPNMTRTRTTIVIHTFNMKVDRIVCNNLTSESYNYDALNIDEVLEEYWKSNQPFFDVKKLLTNEQQITIKQQMDKARELNPHSLLTEQILSKLHKNESRFGERDIVSDLENGVEVTEDNIDEWNDDGQYSVEDMVSVQDYIKDPYDILYLVDIDGVYQGGLVFLTEPSFSRTGVTIHIDTINRKVIHTEFGHSTSESYDYYSMKIDEVLEEYWKMGRGVQTTLNLKHSDSYYSYRDSE